MALVTHPARTGPPLRSVWTLMLIGLLTLALVAGLIIAGSLMLRPSPDDKFLGVAMVPTLEDDTIWDASGIAGLSLPTGMDVGPDGNLYVVNAGAQRDPRDIARRAGASGAGAPKARRRGNSTSCATRQHRSTRGVAWPVAPDGSVYVNDTVNDRVQQFDAEGGFVREWGTFGPADGQFLEPFDVDAGPDGTVYVVDDQRDDIQRFDPDGAYLETIGSHGTGEGQMNFTGSVVVDGAGTLYNADYNNDRVQAWGPDGAFLWSLGSRGNEPGRFVTPVDVAVDTSGNLYVVSSKRIQVFGPDRQLLSVWDAPAGTLTDDWVPSWSRRAGRSTSASRPRASSAGCGSCKLLRPSMSRRLVRSLRHQWRQPHQPRRHRHHRCLSPRHAG